MEPEERRQEQNCTDDTQSESSSEGGCDLLGDKSSCSYCQRLILWKPPTCDEDQQREEAFYQEYFHDQCDKCDKLKREFPVDVSTCAFCHHLRLGHLFRCVLPRLPPENHDMLSIHISTGYYQQVSPPDCTICKMFSGVLESKDRSQQGISICREDERLNVKIDGKVMEVHQIEEDQFEPYNDIREQVDWKLVRGWNILPCNENPDVPRDFRVIDVSRNCLVKPLPPFCYAALRYL